MKEIFHYHTTLLLSEIDQIEVEFKDEWIRISFIFFEIIDNSSSIIIDPRLKVYILRTGGKIRFLYAQYHNNEIIF